MCQQLCVFEMCVCFWVRVSLANFNPNPHDIMLIHTLKGYKNTYRAHLTVNYCICMCLEDILNPQCNNNNLKAVIEAGFGKEKLLR